MSNISIVTAFYDIGRGDWTPDKGLPSYLHRTTNDYIERFTHLTKLANELIVVTTPDIGVVLKNIRNDIKIIEYDPFIDYAYELNHISMIQNSAEFQQSIRPSQIKNPEYWSSKYVLINILKSHFVNMAIERGLVTNDTVSWLDFGYCRSEDTLPKSLKWSYDFDPSKIHLFDYKDLLPNKTINQIISTNDVHILGAKIVAHKDMWPIMENKIFEVMNLLFTNNLIDDDQTLLLMCSRMYPNLFELHRIPDHQNGSDPFIIFKQFNRE
jgi:protein YibB